MQEKRRSIRVDVNNICEIKMPGLTGIKYCFLKDISILGVGFLSPEKFNKGEKADLSIVLENKIIDVEVSIIAAYHKEQGQNRYGAEIISINPAAEKILEDYVTSRVHENWAEKVKSLVR